MHSARPGMEAIAAIAGPRHGKAQPLKLAGVESISSQRTEPEAEAAALSQLLADTKAEFSSSIVTSFGRLRKHFSCAFASSVALARAAGSDVDADSTDPAEELNSTFGVVVCRCTQYRARVSYQSAIKVIAADSHHSLPALG